MKKELITEIMQYMLSYLDNAQLMQLQKVMEHTLLRYEISAFQVKQEEDNSYDLIAMFIAAKRIEGCSEKTLRYYQATIDAMVSSLGRNVRNINTEDLRTYLTEYQSRNHSSRVTIDNIRRIFSSFFSCEFKIKITILKNCIHKIICNFYRDISFCYSV